ncbi:hypothetical protein PhCBS80983_g01806 [Powellomyces hirtus]|uniref:PP2A regulatory subunit B'' EF-hand domain-containing protein n=1 Tax=Powellomyces hirtus TaxID=109895 RepID=A0A507E8J4_9FUNG|nr:hypothetical protein PhCBS80983_g01806 [Powellomyces hirtus]
MLLLHTVRRVHAHSLAWLSPTPSLARTHLQETGSSSTPPLGDEYLAALRARMNVLAAAAVSLLKVYAQFAAQFVPDQVSITLQAVAPTELTRVLKVLIAADDPACGKEEPAVALTERTEVALLSKQHDPVSSEELTSCPSSSASSHPHVAPHIPSVTATLADAPGGLSSPTTTTLPTPLCARRAQELDSLMSSAREIWSQCNYDEDTITSAAQLVPLTVHCGLPPYVNASLYHLLTRKSLDDINESPVASWSQFERTWRHIYEMARGDLNIAIFYILSMTHPDRSYLIPSDFSPIVREVVMLHPAFEFLRTASSFQDRYVETVIARLFTIRPIHSHRISFREYRKTRFLNLLSRLERSTACLGLNIPPPFSYKDFYVIYCKFWKLDMDRDMLLTSQDLERYSHGALTRLVCQRVVDLYGSGQISIPLSSQPHAVHDTYPKVLHQEKALTFMDFVRFIRAVEDKSHPTSIGYWFHVLDLEQDGRISLLELETVWAWQEERLLALEDYSFPSLLGVIWDTLNLDPQKANISLSDLKRSPLATSMVFDLLFDIKGREGWLRRTCDPGFRFAENVRITLEEGDDVCEEYNGMGEFPWHPCHDHDASFRRRVTLT